MPPTLPRCRLAGAEQTTMKDLRETLSTLWIFDAFNSAYGEITTLSNSV